MHMSSTWTKTTWADAWRWLEILQPTLLCASCRFVISYTFSRTLIEFKDWQEKLGEQVPRRHQKQAQICLCRYYVGFCMPCWIMLTRACWAACKFCSFCLENTGTLSGKHRLLLLSQFFFCCFCDLKARDRHDRHGANIFRYFSFFIWASYLWQIRWRERERETRADCGWCLASANAAPLLKIYQGLFFLPMCQSSWNWWRCRPFLTRPGGELCGRDAQKYRRRSKEVQKTSYGLSSTTSI